MIRELKPDNIRYIIVHCSDSPSGRGDNARTIHRWHTGRARDPFDCIGYHKVILENGTVEVGRQEYMRGAHAGPDYNWRSLGVCLIGRDGFTSAQYRALWGVLKDWKSRYDIQKVVGHRDVNPSKTCPNFDVAEFCDNPEPWTMDY